MASLSHTHGANLIHIVKKLIPKSVRRPIGRLYTCFRVKSAQKCWWDKKMVLRLAAYNNLSIVDCKKMLELGKRLNADLWNVLSPQTAGEITRFYELSPYFVFDLAYWHMSGLQRIIRKSIISLAHGDILDYGGGTGELSIALARNGNNVTYVDIPGATMDFAKWLFSQEEVDIVVKDPVSIFQSQSGFDTIVCFNVIEHVSNPKELLKFLTTSLREDGILIIKGLDSQQTENHPMHIVSGYDGEHILQEMGLRKNTSNYGALKSGWIWIKQPCSLEKNIKIES